MSNLDVALRLKLVNGLKAGAGEAKRDLAGIEKAAQKVGGSRGLDKLSKNLEASESRAKRLERTLVGLRNARGPVALTSDLDAAAKWSGRLEGVIRFAHANPNAGR